MYREEQSPQPLPPAETIIGRNVVRKEGQAKVMGQAQYVDDLTHPDMLYGKTIRSTIARGTLTAIHFDPAFDWSAVVVADYRDIPGRNVVALIEEDQPLLVEREIRHHAEPILLLACRDRELLEQAARHIQISYQEQPPVLGMEQALAAGERGERDLIIRPPDNVIKKYLIECGDLAAGFRQAEVIVEGSYRTGSQEHVYIEPQGMIAIPGADGSLTLQGSLQCPYYVHKAIKTLFNLPDDKVIVIQTTTGGGFGGKEEYPNMIAGHAALLAWKSGKPVKLVYDRQEDIAATTKRHPAIVRHRTGVTRDGRLVAADIDVIMDGGAYATLSAVVLSRGAIHALGPYRCPNVRIRARVMATNTPPAGAFRGFGAPQTCFAYEMQMNRIAQTLGLSPLELRRKNLVRPGDLTVTGQKLSLSVSAEQVLEAAVQHAHYEAARAAAAKSSHGHKRTGVGLSLFYHGAGFTGSGERRLPTRAGVELLPEGKVRVLTSSIEMGQGTETVFCQIAAAALGISYDDVIFAQPNTARVPDSGPTVASRTCMIVGKALQDAAREMKSRLESFAATKWDAPLARLHNGELWLDHRSAISFAHLARQYCEARGALKVLHGYSLPPDITWDDNTYRGDAYPVFGWGADVAKVEVDLDTFEIKVLECVTAIDCGKALHPLLLEGQIEGGTLQAVGHATLEQVIMENGRVLNDRMATCLIPTALDAPEMRVVLIENPYPFGPHGAKGIGELPMDGGAAAVAAAVWHATGVLPEEVPMTPEKLHAALSRALAAQGGDATVAGAIV
ncbi:MAG: xanthine dehydrogenase family protein molybdopterin-binding subunit [candidate division KSB1 bacterium]|nr:xanthine dehydrogenase family protein molybdopterin-binding subunit [candidate division KSB1 bacterium]MDZ7276188.1 xanthine dehydrogenase family protein molybdopterin-binding subunit [candidate division KSB1 bacterium]MDZ7287032.1 xanthine dehydrogenase family protein molybdopterin-binding subunit [candidate division KSB1 bacterium]MDZ7297043.1 xanthine dehydrogenase family protein molybdopterin-binding subunit [candidate division KSB1 bacterium]MDZ7307196.1 xanthine dehydrogenase family pr